MTKEESQSIIENQDRRFFPVTVGFLSLVEIMGLTPEFMEKDDFHWSRPRSRPRPLRILLGRCRTG